MDEICKEKHRRIDECLLQNKRQIEEQDKRIDKLDRADAQKSEAINNLCLKIEGQTKAIWGLVSSIFVMLGGFFIWYVQTIGGR